MGSIPSVGDPGSSPGRRANFFLIKNGAYILKWGIKNAASKSSLDDSVIFRQQRYKYECSLNCF